MPLNNDVCKLWAGWLIDGLGGREEYYQKALVLALETRSIPKSSVTTGTVHMWWLKNSRHIDVTSDLDGLILSTIHIEEYGRSLWVGRAIESYSQSNYYKRMAASALIETIDSCIRETALTLVDATAIHSVADIGREK
jgi:hypothetical protein